MPRLIQGYVAIENGDRLEGVSVSNGREIVQTDSRGRYQLPCCSETRFVFITVPAGYAAADRFYFDLNSTDNFDFALQHHPESESTSFSFVQITDLHTTVDDRVFLEQDLAQIHREVGDRARFIVATGDLTDGGQREEYKTYLGAIAKSELPVYHAVGNHDDRAEKWGTNFMEVLGPMYYSFDYGPLHFVVYDGRRRRRTDSTDQECWMRADLEFQPPNKPVAIINHYPWGSEFYDRWKAYPIIATLSGHWHSTRLFVDGQTVHYNTPSLGFGGSDQSPRAYRLFTYERGKLKTISRALVPSEIFSGISFRPSSDNVAGVLHRFEETHPELGADWRLFHGNARRTGSAVIGPHPPLSLAWRAGTGGSIHLATPLVAEGLVFQSTKNEDTLSGNGLAACDARDGALQWRHTTNSAIKRAPAYCDGRLFLVTTTGLVQALTAASGERQWSYELGDPSQLWVYTTPLVVRDRVYIGANSCVVALDQETGDVVWRRDDLVPDDFPPCTNSPSACGECIVVGFYGQPTNLMVLDAATGKTVWTKAEGKPYDIYSTPVIDEDGTIYTVSAGAVRAYDLETGALKWEAPFTLNRVRATPALAEGRLFVCTGSGTLHALEAGCGRELWKWGACGNAPLFTPYAREGGVTLASPVVAGNCVYVAAANGYLYALDTATGTCVWGHNLQIPLAAPPAISGNGLWIGGCDGFIYAFSSSKHIALL